MRRRRKDTMTQALRRAGNCPTCLATGQLPQRDPMVGRIGTCPDCEGTGRVR